MKRKKRRNRQRIIFSTELLFFGIVALLLCVFVRMKDKVGQIQTVAIDQSKIHTNEETLQSEKLRRQKGFQTIALLGVDSRTRKKDGGSIEASNSDTMIIAGIHHDTGKIRLVSVYRDTYLQTSEEKHSFTLANDAYNRGGYYQFLNMLNRNLDLAVSDFITVDFKAMSKLVDALGGLDVTMTHDEVVHMNNHCIETSKETNEDYEPLEPKEEEQVYHLNGVQVVSYMRIRQDSGLDFKRTVRQREIIYKLVEKIKSSGLTQLYRAIDEVFPYIYTNLSKSDMIAMGMDLIGYELADTAGFPFDHMWGSITKERLGIDCIVPVTLENNVKQLHEFLYPGQSYTPGAVVQSISREISEKSGWGEADIPKNSFDGGEVRTE